MNKIITIGREFGSGGRELGRRIAEELNIAYYDQEILMEISRHTDMSIQYIQHIIEHRPFHPFPIHTRRSFYHTGDPILQQHQSIYHEQHRIICELSEKSDCVIVGRCADYILADKKPFRLFVYADTKSKVRRCLERASAHEHLSEQEIIKQMRTIDKERAKYYNFYTGQVWGDKLNYELCINTSGFQITDMVPVIARLF